MYLCTGVSNSCTCAVESTGHAPPGSIAPTGLAEAGRGWEAAPSLGWRWRACRVRCRPLGGCVPRAHVLEAREVARIYRRHRCSYSSTRTMQAQLPQCSLEAREVARRHRESAGQHDAPHGHCGEGGVEPRRARRPRSHALLDVAVAERRRRCEGQQRPRRHGRAASPRCFRNSSLGC